MKATTIRHPIDAPPERVWETLIDFERSAEWAESITRIEMLTPAPVGRGTRWKETRRVMNKEQTEEFEIIDFNPPASYTARCESCGAEMLFKLSVHADNDSGSVVEMTLSARGLTMIAKVMCALTGWMMAGMCRKAFVKDMEDLERSISGRKGG